MFVCRCLYVSLCMYIQACLSMCITYIQLQYLHMHVYIPTKFHNAGYILRQYCHYCHCNTIVMQEHMSFTFIIIRNSTPLYNDNMPQSLMLHNMSWGSLIYYLMDDLWVYCMMVAIQSQSFMPIHFSISLSILWCVNWWLLGWQRTSGPAHNLLLCCI